MKKRKALFILLLLTVSFFAQTALTQFIPLAYGDGENWLTGWSYRKSHEIDPATGAGTNYAVKILLMEGAGTDSGDTVYLPGLVESRFGDVRFTDDNGNTLLDYWFETVNAGVSATVWVKVADSLETSAQTIYVYWGKSDVMSRPSILDTFLWGQDFRLGMDTGVQITQSGGEVRSTRLLVDDIDNATKMQGVVIDDDYVWITHTEVGVSTFIIRYDKATLTTDIVADLTEGSLFHAGGIDSDSDGYIYIPLSEQIENPTSPSKLLKYDKDLNYIETICDSSAHGNDHWGNVAIDEENGILYIGEWNSDYFYRYTIDGTYIDKLTTPTGYTAIQDVQIYEGHLYGSKYLAIEDGQIMVINLDGFVAAGIIMLDNTAGSGHADSNEGFCIYTPDKDNSENADYNFYLKPFHGTMPAGDQTNFIKYEYQNGVDYTASASDYIRAKTYQNFDENVTLVTRIEQGGNRKHNLGFAETVPAADDWAILNNQDGNVYLRLKNDADDSGQQAVTTYAGGTYVDVEVMLFPSADNMTVIFDGTSGTYSDSGQYPNEDMYPFAQLWGTSDDDLNVVFMLVRKNVSPEPAHGDWGSIEFTSGGSEAGENWLTGWTYRKQFNVTNATPQTDYQVRVGVHYDYSFPDGRFYSMSDRWTPISGNPTNRHGMSPLHSTRIQEANLVLDGASRTYIAYDTHWDGSELRLYYTDDLEGTWTEFSGNPIRSGAGNTMRSPSVALVGGTLHMFIANRVAGTIERWTGTDGENFTKQEDVITGLDTGAHSVPFIWLNPNDSYWYLYYRTPTPTKTWGRNASLITGFSGRSDTNVVDEAYPTITYRDNTYWMLFEDIPSTNWQVVSWSSSTSPISGYTETSDSPLLINDEACPQIFLSPDGSKCYLFTNRDSPSWYQDMREVYSTSQRSYEVDLDGKGKTDFGDIRFTKSDGDTELDYWLESEYDSANATFWIEVDSLNGIPLNTTLYIYYGKADATTTSDGEATFPLFDHFPGVAINSTKWESYTSGAGTITVADSLAEFYIGTTSDYAEVYTKPAYNYGTNYAVRVNASYPTNSLRHYTFTAWTNRDGAGYPVVVSSESGMIVCFASTNEYLRSGVAAAYEDTDFVITNNVYGIYEVRRDSTTSVDGIMEDGDWQSNTVKVPSGSLNVSIGGESNPGGPWGAAITMYVDWLVVRKYVTSEPSISGWGSEETETPSGVNPTITSFIISDLSDGDTLFKTLWYRPVMVVDDADGLSTIGTAYFSFETDYGWHNVSYNYQTDVYAVETETGMIMVANGYTEFSGTSLTINFYLYLLESIDVEDNVDIYCRVTDDSSGDSDWSLEQLDYFNILDYVEDVGGSSGWTPTETPSEEPQEEWRDTDDDGIPDWDDPDIDGDDIPNEYDEDIDGDDIPNDKDPEPFIPEEKEERPILFSFKTPSGKIINIINPMYYLKPYQKIIIPFLFLLLAIILYSIYRSRQKKSLDERVSNKITNLGGKMVKR